MLVKPTKTGPLLITGLFVIGLAGCETRQVEEEDQPAAAFKSDVEARLKGFESRLSNVKSQMSGRAEAVYNKIEVRTEQAEEKIETLRDSALPKLVQASEQKERDQIKRIINSTLTEIEGAISQAEDALAGARTQREQFAESADVRLKELGDRYNDLNRKAKDYGGSAKAQLDLVLESAEEAIQEARSSLGTYRDAAEDQADQIQDLIASLLSDASRELDKASEAMQN